LAFRRFDDDSRLIHAEFTPTSLGDVKESFLGAVEIVCAHDALFVQRCFLCEITSPEWSRKSVSSSKRWTLNYVHNRLWSTSFWAAPSFWVYFVCLLHLCWFSSPSVVPVPVGCDNSQTLKRRHQLDHTHAQSRLRPAHHHQWYWLASFSSSHA
jgi:hypothetical protein